MYNAHSFKTLEMANMGITVHISPVANEQLDF